MSEETKHFLIVSEKTRAAIEKSDVRLSKRTSSGWNGKQIFSYVEVLDMTGRVEVGYRACCGCTHFTSYVYDEWKKICKRLIADGNDISTESVKHKNAYATINGGFWNSEIYRVKGSQ